MKVWTGTELASLISSYRFQFANEDELQRQIAEVLVKHDVLIKREARINTADRLDFLCAGSIAIEVKIHGSLAQVTTQLHRYAQNPVIEEIVLVTSKARHRRGIPATLCGKKIHIANLDQCSF